MDESSYTPTLANVALRLQYGREQRDWSMDDLAYQSGLSAPLVQKIVNRSGTSELASLRQLCLVAEALSADFRMSFHVVN